MRHSHPRHDQVRCGVRQVSGQHRQAEQVGELASQQQQRHQCPRQEIDDQGEQPPRQPQPGQVFRQQNGTLTVRPKQDSRQQGADAHRDENPGVPQRTSGDALRGHGLPIAHLPAQHVDPPHSQLRPPRVGQQAQPVAHTQHRPRFSGSGQLGQRQQPARAQVGNFDLVARLVDHHRDMIIHAGERRVRRKLELQRAVRPAAVCVPRIHNCLLRPATDRRHHMQDRSVGAAGRQQANRTRLERRRQLELDPPLLAKLEQLWRLQSLHRRASRLTTAHLGPRPLRW